MNYYIFFLFIYLFNIYLASSANNGDLEEQNNLNLLAMITAGGVLKNNQIPPYNTHNLPPQPPQGVVPTIINHFPVHQQNSQPVPPNHIHSIPLPTINNHQQNVHLPVVLLINLVVANNTTVTKDKQEIFRPPDYDVTGEFHCRHDGCSEIKLKSAYRNMHEKRNHPIGNDHTTDCHICQFYSVPTNKKKKYEPTYNVQGAPTQPIPPEAGTDEGANLRPPREPKRCIHTGCAADNI